MYISFHLACLNFSQPYTLDSRGSPSPTALAVSPQIHTLHGGSIDTHASASNQLRWTRYREEWKQRLSGPELIPRVFLIQKIATSSCSLFYMLKNKWLISPTFLWLFSSVICEEMVKQVLAYMVEYTSRENWKDFIPLKTRRKVLIGFQIIFLILTVYS